MPVFTPGTRLHDRYLLEQRIGSGGMAQVWRAHDLVLGRQVAVKTLTGQAVEDPQLRAGARREAQAAAKLTHPNITAVHDYAELDLGAGKAVPYLVMELLEGETLADRIARGPLPWSQAAQIGSRIASALTAAHAQGVVHQDIKPANIMLTTSGPKVLDFGIASMQGHREPTGWIVGTPAYAPPERLRQAPPDPSADVFGLGAVMAEMVTGRKPFPLEDWEDAAGHRYPIPELPSSVPPQAAQAIRSALDPSPKARPAAAALVRAFGSPDPGPSPTLMAPAGSISASASVPRRPVTTAQPATSALPIRRGTSPALVAGLSFAGLVIIIGAIVLLSGVFRPGGTPGAGDGTGTGTTPANVPVAGPSATPAPTGSPSGVPALLAAFDRAVEEGIDRGQVRQNKAKELRDRVDELRKEWQQQRNKGNNFVNKVADAREKINDMADDGDIAPGLAATLDGILAQMATSAPRRDG